jgi:tRNA pseudouridine32 synthase/23S rRNA pseudouridine746 synthase/23S rRNA pseudouridine1911/1915/1917 synthase
MKLKVPRDMSLLEGLSLLAPTSSKTSFRSWIKEGRVSVDSIVAKNSSSHLHEGQVIYVGPRPNFIEGGIRIIYEDKHIIVVDKPEGLLSVSTNFEKSETVFALLKKHYRPRMVYVVHRLDQDTSGAMVFALTEEARDGLKKIFENHDIERAYTAIIEGHPSQPKGTWQSYLVEDGNYMVRSTTDADEGRLAITHYVVMGNNKRHTWVNLTLETGRKNQIRVHCKDAGHPVAGDKKYGAKSNPLKRLGLHAHLLSFDHPITKKRMRFLSPLPQRFEILIRPQEVL